MPETNLDYQNLILQDVSRTFALTIPQLPEQLATVVGNGYLLCRIADTIEDDPELSTEAKQQFAAQFIDVLSQQYPVEQFEQQLSTALSSRMLAAERDLVANTHKVVALTHSFNAVQQQALMRCVQVMLNGMLHYQQFQSLAGLTDMNAMDSYCYHVAGVVGEMLTEVYCDALPALQSQRQLMMNLGVSFGLGLQMTNILKDIWDDQQRGACWLPQSLFSQYGIQLNQLEQARGTPDYASAINELISVAHAHLKNALDYTLMIPRSQPGIRKFCLWAIGMAILTLRKIHKHPHFTQSQQVKISRRSVKAVIAVSNLLVRQDTSLRLAFTALAKTLPEAHQTITTLDTSKGLA